MEKGELVKYSEAFKLQVIGELECGRWASQCEARRKYGIRGNSTLAGWLRKYGRRDLMTKIVRVERPEERDQIQALKERIRDLERALADSKVEETLHKAYFEIVCEEFSVKDVEGLKKNIAARLSSEGLRSARRRLA